jgi:hypothetical protein
MFTSDKSKQIQNTGPYTCPQFAVPSKCRNEMFLLIFPVNKDREIKLRLECNIKCLRDNASLNFVTMHP